jgi:CBS-domain-containing membrane protein
VFITLFAVTSGAVALGILTAVAYLTALPIVFAPLAASAFILFYRPMAERACPRNVVLSHMVALIAGLSALVLMQVLFSESNILNAWVMSWPRVAANTLAMGLAGAAMLLLRCAHAPAAATALIASMGYIVNPHQVIGFMAAVILLVVEALLFNRIMGGIPYPVWGYDAETAKDYRALSDPAQGQTSFWQQVCQNTSTRR